MRYLILILMTITFTFCAEETAKPLPAEAQKAVDAMEAQINKARYDCLVKLKKITADITRTGNLEAAMIVKAKETEIMKEAMAVSKPDSDKTAVVGKWMFNGHVYNLKTDGIAAFDNKDSGKWVINGSKLIITWENGFIDTLTLPIKNNSLSGTNNVGAPISITKIADSK